MKEIHFSIRLSVAFFITGTILLFLFYRSLSPEIALIAYWYTRLAILVCWIYTAVLLFRFLNRKINLRDMLKTFGVMALNIPVALLYAWIMIFLLSFARITFQNNTGSDIALLTIKGCGEHEVINLKEGDSKTVWIKITGDCAVNIEYELNGKLQRETAISYLTQNGGIVTTYRIGK